ncbi:MAG: DUF2933 domain-containing protein [Gammaproteobacteria bacterium]|nr:DUF2933 domain-containing protein [Gammaproteobacteria bacterium]
MDHNPSSDHQRHSNGRMWWVFLAFAAIAGFFLLTEHRAHVLGALPYVLLALCPLMHLFGHGGHGGGGSRRGGSREH